MEGLTIVLLHSPFVDASTWGELPARLRELGYAVVVVAVESDDAPPYAVGYVARAAQQINIAAPDSPLVLVAHSGAGPLLPQIGRTQRAAHRRIAGYVFLDATLPRAGASRLDLLHAQDEELAHEVRDSLERGELAPVWGDDELASDGLGAVERAAITAGARPRGLDFFEEVVPHPDDWPDAPVGFLRTSTGRTAVAAARVAQLRGFDVRETGGGHFAALTAAPALATAIQDLVTRL